MAVHGTIPRDQYQRKRRRPRLRSARVTEARKSESERASEKEREHMREKEKIITYARGVMHIRGMHICVYVRCSENAHGWIVCVYVCVQYVHVCVAMCDAAPGGRGRPSGDVARRRKLPAAARVHRPPFARSSLAPAPIRPATLRPLLSAPPRARAPRRASERASERFRRPRPVDSLSSLSFS